MIKLTVSLIIFIAILFIMALVLSPGPNSPWNPKLQSCPSNSYTEKVISHPANIIYYYVGNLMIPQAIPAWNETIKVCIQ